MQYFAQLEFLEIACLLQFYQIYGCSFCSKEMRNWLQPSEKYPSQKVSLVMHAHVLFTRFKCPSSNSNCFTGAHFHIPK